jgi:hypothetical protein
MYEESIAYEPPAMVEVGAFAELTRWTNTGRVVDFFGGWWNPW